MNSEVLDSAAALASVGGDPEFLCEIVGLIQAAWPTLLDYIRQDIAAGDLHALEADARLARAAAQYVSARRAYLAALQLQFLAMQRDLEGAKRISENLEEAVAKLQPVLSSLKKFHGSLPSPSSLGRQRRNSRARAESGVSFAPAKSSVVERGHIPQ
jgi:hypothetical protein